MTRDRVTKKFTTSLVHKNIFIWAKHWGHRDIRTDLSQYLIQTKRRAEILAHLGPALTFLAI